MDDAQSHSDRIQSRVGLRALGRVSGGVTPRHITEHPTREGKVYCCVVVDAHSRRVVGWSTDTHQASSLVTKLYRWRSATVHQLRAR
jgi:transposase InsO family protein